mgnify:CR=1 FL=1
MASAWMSDSISSASAANTSRWDCAYPPVEVLPDDTIVTTTYGHWTKGESPYIVSVRLKLEELDAMAKRKEFLK